MTAAIATDSLAPAATATPPLATVENRPAATLELFVPHARQCVAVLQQQARQWEPEGADGAEPIRVMRRSLRQLGAQFDVLRCVGAARLCRATDAAIAASDTFPSRFVLAAAAAVAAYLDELAVDFCAEIDDVRGLLAELRGDGDLPVTMTVAGEFARDQDEFLGAAREQVRQLRQNLEAYAGQPDDEPLASARAAARGIAGIGGLLDLAPLVEVAAAVSGGLLRAAPTAAHDGAGLDRLLAGVDVLQRLLDGLDGGPMPSLEQVAAALDRCAEAPDSAPFAAELPAVSAPDVVGETETETEMAPSTAESESAAPPMPQPTPTPTPARAMAQFLTVVVDGQRYGLAADRLGAVVALADLDPGMAVVDLRERLGLAAIATTDATSAVIVECGDGDSAARLALVVDAVEDIVAGALESGDGIRVDLIGGCVRLDDGMLPVLDVEALPGGEPVAESPPAMAVTEAPAPVAAAVVAEAAAPLPRRVQTVIVDSMLYGLDAARVDDLVAAVGRNGAALPTIDLRAERVGVDARRASAPTCMVVVRAAAAAGPARVGLLVDELREVVELVEDQVERQHGSCILGSARLANGILRLLDVDRVLQATEPTPPAAQ